MDKINKDINSRIKLEDTFSSKNKSNFNNLPVNYSNKTFNYVNHNNYLEHNIYDINNKNNNCRKELVMAKIIISELQDKIDELNNEKKDLENQLNEALNTIKFLHSDYISLTDKFDKVNQTIIIDSNNNEKKFNEKINELKIKNDQLNDELLTKKEINKLQEEALNRKITLLTKKLEKTEEELDSYKKKNEEIYKLEMNKNQINSENIILREDNIKISNKYNDDRKKFYKEIEEYKNKIKKLENENFILTSELNDKKDMLEKEHKINFQYNKLDKFLNNTIQEKNNSYEAVNEKYTKLFKEYENYKMENSKEKNEIMEKYNKLKNEYENKKKLEEEYIQKINVLTEKLKNKNKNEINNEQKLSNNNEEFEIIKEQKNYILNLLLKITPNVKLIKQIIEINKEIIQLERQKITINNTNKNNPKLNSILPKIDEQINIFKNHLASLEDELINVDFGSSKSNIENSLSSY